jgi:23S rRNA pseudouridine955/2504/2580 synthase
MKSKILESLIKLIVWEDENYFIINKPYGVSSLDERFGCSKNNILRMAREYCPTAQLCHRLDKETSGVIAIAKNPEAYRHLAIQFEKREVKKIYHAIVNGTHNLDGVEVNYPIAPAGNSSVKIDYHKGKLALSYFRTLKMFKDATLVECFPITGRMHQIRIHLAQLKAPIVSDKQYGGRDIFLSSLKRNFKLKKNTEEKPIIQRIALHAFAISFKPLNSQNQVTVSAAYPKDFKVLLKILEEYSQLF